MRKYRIDYTPGPIPSYHVIGPGVDEAYPMAAQADDAKDTAEHAFAAGFAAGVEVGMRRRAKASLKRKGKR